MGRLKAGKGYLVMAVVAAALGSARCGVPVCAFGAGDCAQMYANAPGSTAQTNSNNLMVVTTLPISGFAKGQPIQIQPQSGTACANGRYNYDFTPNDGSQVNNQNIFVPQSTALYKFTITDCSTPRKTGTLNLDVK